MQITSEQKCFHGCCLVATAREACRRRTLLAMFLTAMLWGSDCDAGPFQPPVGQRRQDVAGFGNFDPQKFLEQFFGEESQEQKRKLASIRISPQEEQKFGNQALQAFLGQLSREGIRVTRRGREVAYLQSLVNELKPFMRNGRRYRKITVLIAETPETDARCFPGGTLIVFRGMLDAAQSEAALVAVLGHEMSHIDHGHQLRYLKSMKLAQQTYSAPHGMFDLDKMMSNTMVIAQSFARPFRPEQETEADADGVAWAYRAGYDPMEFAKLFLRMDRRHEGPGNVPAFFRTHPYHRDRYEAVVAQLKQLQKETPRDKLYVGQRNLIEFIPRSKRTYDE